MHHERDNIRRMHGYQWGEQPRDQSTIKLNTNENPYPPPAAVRKALAEFNVDMLRTYPQPTADPLRDRLANLHGVTRDHIVVTHGGDEALRLAVATFVDPGATMGSADPSYSLYPVLADIQDARFSTVRLDDQWRLPAESAELLNAAGARLTCIVNPHAPSGTLLERDTISSLARALNGVLLVDEAYVDFVDPELGHDLAPLTRTHDNLLLLRTFSKGYSLAGLRLGYLIGAPDLIDPIISKTRDSYNIDAISQALGCAAIDAQADAALTWAQVRRDRATLAADLAALGLLAPPSQTNFLLVAVPADAPLDARALQQALKARGILVRHFAAPGLDHRLRITVGTPEQNARLLAALAELLAG